MEEFAKLIPQKLWNVSGKAFHSGRLAFSGQRDLYVLGFNPGGEPEDNEKETVKNHTGWVLSEFPDRWSAFLDEVWPTKRMQNMMKYLFNQIDIDLREIPDSDLIFVRSRGENYISKIEKEKLLGVRWPFHKAVIDHLGIRVILCLGKETTRFIKEKIGAHRKIDEIVYQTARNRYEQSRFVGQNGVQVVQLLHPSQFSWTHPASDPSDLVKRALAG